MKHTFYLIPVSEKVGLDLTASALQEALGTRATRACICQSVALSLSEAEEIVAREGWDRWLVGVVDKLQDAAHGVDVLIASAFAPSSSHPFISLFNRKLIRALDAKVILVAGLDRSMDRTWGEQIALAAHLYSEDDLSRCAGCFLERLRPDRGETIDAAAARVREKYSALGLHLPELAGLVPEPTAPGTTARHLDGEWLDRQYVQTRKPRISPPAFYARLARQAKAADRRIILPESTDPRIIRAAAACVQQGIARCVLLGAPEAIKRVAIEQKIALPQEVAIMDADAIRSEHVEDLIKLRGSAELSPQEAARQLQDDGLLATVLLALGQADGLVSGAVHSSAATVRAALQLVKTRPGIKRASSIFFMCLPDQVLVYGDCAVNPDPDAETLAEIAVQSADTALHFGLPARVAMLSYSTEKSGSGPDVDKVRAATGLAQNKRPDLLIDGPLQYDAAAVPDVARRKAPESAVAGNATVYIFPDLDTGNITYKAVQHSAGIVCIGPVLQGLRQPVSDLSRGASVEDIVYTVAAVAVQATQA